MNIFDKQGKVTLPPEPRPPSIKFQVREVGCPGKIIGYMWADNACEAAAKLGGKAVQSCPGWARVEIPGKEPVELSWVLS